MNETGLVVETMYLKNTRYPARDARPFLHTFQWVQFQLDSASTVREIIESDQAVRIRPSDSGTVQNYLVADGTGDCAVKYIQGDATNEFIDYSHQSHRNLVRSTFGSVGFLNHYSVETLELLTRYPDRLLCQDKIATDQNDAGSIRTGKE